VVAATVVASLLVLAIASRRFRTSRNRGQNPTSHRQTNHDSTPRGQLVAHSDSIRELLANQFGTAWRAKTTEELSSEPQLLERLGGDERRDLIRFLDEIDQLKFAPERSKHQHDQLTHELAAWEPKLALWKRQLQNGTSHRPDSLNSQNGIGRSASARARTMTKPARHR
jgi:hypothetical protein